MNDYGTVEIVLAARRLIVLQRIVLGLAVGSGLVYWLTDRDAWTSPFVVGLTVVMVGYVLYLPLRLLITGEAIVITDRGVVDRTSGLGFIWWNEIRSAQLQPFMGLNLVALDLTDVQAVIGRLSPLRRWTWRYYLKRFGARPTVAGSFVEGGADALMRVINERATGGRTERAV